MSVLRVLMFLLEIERCWREMVVGKEEGRLETRGIQLFTRKKKAVWR